LRKLREANMKALVRRSETGDLTQKRYVIVSCPFSRTSMLANDNSQKAGCAPTPGTELTEHRSSSSERHLHVS